jgi:5-methylcytosine-specific restriction endonuclease McrA
MKVADKKVYQHIRDTQDCCLLCGGGYDGNLVMHHVRYGSCGRHTYIGNIARLCVTCHLAVHADGKYYKPILIEKVNKLYKEEL